MLDPISLTIAAKLFLIIKQYAVLIPLTRKGLFQLIRESRAAKKIEVERVEALRSQVSSGERYAYFIVRYVIELGFYLVLLHSVLSVHTLFTALFFCLEDWLFYWLTISVPYFFANRWEKQLGVTSNQPRFIDIVADPAIVVERVPIEIPRQDE